MFIHLNLDPIERPRHGKTNVRGSGQDAAKAFGVFFQAFWCPFLPVPYYYYFIIFIGLSATPLRAKGFALVRPFVRSSVRDAISRTPRIRF